MKIRVVQGLPFVQVTLSFQDKSLMLENVVLDTGSASSIFKMDLVSQIGIVPEPHDTVRQVRGVGGIEFVLAKQLDELRVGSLQAKSFSVEIGAMGYGFDFDGILGFDFLQQVGAVIDLNRMKISTSIVDDTGD